MRKKAVLVISFGTSYHETREKNIEAIERDIREAFPEHEFRRAFTSPTIIKIMRERDGLQTDHVEQALERLCSEGFTEVVAQPTHVIRGFEYDRVMEVIRKFQGRFETLVCGEPLLTDMEDYREVVRILGGEFAQYRGEKTDIVLMGHGTEHVANFSYERLQRVFLDAGLADFLVGTVEASPTLQNMVKLVEERGSERVVLAPLMVVAGDHASNDMAGDGEDSWRSRFAVMGYEVECVMKGMGEYADIRRMYVRHAQDAARKAEERGRQDAARESGERGRQDAAWESGETGWQNAAWKSEAMDRRKAERCGTLYGIGVGPGDPELLTLKAARLIRECDVIAVPGEDWRSSIAWQIALRAVPEAEEKECIGVNLPMTRDKAVLKACHERAAETVIGYLEQGKQVGFLNLGDVTLYATYLYIHRLVLERGYRAELVSGIPSFCAVAAELNTGLAESADQFHILSQPGQVEAGLRLPGTKVIMKMGKNIEQVKGWIRDAGMDAMMVENCGLPGQRICRSVDEIPVDAGYYSLLIVKEHKNGGEETEMEAGKRIGREG